MQHTCVCGLCIASLAPQLCPTLPLTPGLSLGLPCPAPAPAHPGPQWYEKWWEVSDWRGMKELGAEKWGCNARGEPGVWLVSGRWLRCTLKVGPGGGGLQRVGRG